MRSQQLPLGIKTDNTLETNSVITQDGSTADGINIFGIEGGTVAGDTAAGSANLFHSFEEFSITENEAIYFNTVSGIDSIFSRVTGDKRSDIFGAIGVRGDSNGANLFLINPNGIVFGENADLLLDGSFTATTADAIQFGRDGLFSAANPTSSQLLAIQPSAFFFSSSNPYARIESRSSARPTSNRNRGLQVLDGEALTFVAGDILLNGASLNAWEGRVSLAAIAEPGSVNIEDSAIRGGRSLTVPSITRRGNITLINDTDLDVQLTFGGDIELIGNNIDILSGSRLLGGIETEKTNGVEEQSGNVIIDATGNVSVTGVSPSDRRDRNGDVIVSSVENVIENNAEGQSGSILITARSLTVSDEAKITTATSGTGNAGGINIRLQENATFTNGNLSSEVSENSSGQGGSVVVRAENIYLRDGTRISSRSSGERNAGPIALIAKRRLVAQNGNILTNATNSAGGAIVLSAKTVILRDASLVRSTSTTEGLNTNVGSGSVLTPEETNLIEAASGNSEGLTVIQTGNSNFFSVSGNPSFSNGEVITQNSGENVVIVDENGIFTSEDGIVTRNDGAISIRDTFNNLSRTDAGDINISADALVVINASDILASSASGNGGEITLGRTIFSDPLNPINPTSGGLSDADIARLIGNPRVDVNADGGVSPGAISINTTNLVENNLTELPDNLINSESIVSSSCIARDGSNGGVFTFTGGDRTPQSPIESSNNIYSTGTVRSISPITETQTSANIIEPSEIYQLADGRLVMSRDCQG